MSSQEIEQVNEIKESNQTNKSNLSIPYKYSLLLSSLSSFSNFRIFTKTLDSFLGFSSIGQLIFGIVSLYTDDKITSIGYISAGIFSGITFRIIRKMRFLTTMQESVNFLQGENKELKESNEELKESIDDLESVSDRLNSDLKLLKETVGLLDENAEEVIENLREAYHGIKKENEIYSKLNKNLIYLNILQIIRHYDSNSNFSLKLEDLQKAKKTLLNAFPNLDYNSLIDKINETPVVTKITAKMIFDSMKVKN